MAKVKKKEMEDNEVMNFNPDEEEKEVEVFEDKESDKPKTKKSKDLLVEINPIKNHSCVIGGVRYFFVAGEKQEVPQNVKDILHRENLLQPL